MPKKKANGPHIAGPQEAWRHNHQPPREAGKDTGEGRTVIRSGFTTSTPSLSKTATAAQVAQPCQQPEPPQDPKSSKVTFYSPWTNAKGKSFSFANTVAGSAASASSDADPGNQKNRRPSKPHR
ncbi:hypothetical protein PVAP13_9NG651650 [Panicum virgatum]|uniref:Uncharacterized protein n=1 Tax=Panicum virgatum TaxID=38727 RepID=A0A8T0N6E3_PANVG|nr:hypothetical protein PVAP13_9NG651650 [Panicum virgatum]